MPVVVLSALAPDFHKVDLVRALRSVDGGPLEPALLQVRALLGGEPARVELPTEAEAERFLATVRRAGATASRSP